MPTLDEKLKKVDRRAVLKGLAIGGATLMLPFAGPSRDAQHAQGGDAPPREGFGPPWSLIAPVTAGSYLGAGWRVRSLSRVQEGAAALALVHRSGERAEVHVCRRGGLTRGLAQTAHLDLLLMNDGDGDQPTPEGLGRAIKTVALRVIRRERLEALPGAAPADMMSHNARVRWYGAPESNA